MKSQNTLFDVHNGVFRAHLYHFCNKSQCLMSHRYHKKLLNLFFSLIDVHLFRKHLYVPPIICMGMFGLCKGPFRLLLWLVSPESVFGSYMSLRRFTCLFGSPCIMVFRSMNGAIGWPLLRPLSVHRVRLVLRTFCIVCVIAHALWSF